MVVRRCARRWLLPPGTLCPPRSRDPVSLYPAAAGCKPRQSGGPGGWSRIDSTRLPPTPHHLHTLTHHTHIQQTLARAKPARKADARACSETSAVFDSARTRHRHTRITHPHVSRKTDGEKGRRKENGLVGLAGPRRRVNKGQYYYIDTIYVRAIVCVYSAVPSPSRAAAIHYLARPSTVCESPNPTSRRSQADAVMLAHRA